MIKTVLSDVGQFIGYENDAIMSHIVLGHRPHIKNLIETKIPKDKYSIDIDANIGYFSVMLARNSERVYCLEPKHPVFLQLCGNLFLNQCFNTIPIEVSAFSKHCHMRISDQSNQTVDLCGMDYHKISDISSLACTPWPEGDMMGAVLDDILYEHPGHCGFIRCGSQGSDLEALKGLQRIINRDRPVISFDFESDLVRMNYDQDYDDYLSFFSDVDYHVKDMVDHDKIAIPIR